MMRGSGYAMVIEAAYWAHCPECEWVSEECLSWAAAERAGDQHAEEEHGNE